MVGVPNAGEERIAEYSPFDDPEGGPGRGGDYVSHLAETIKPLVDARFRTLPQRETTGVAGSSMGGLISLFAFFARPDVFGIMGALSPSLWFAGARYLWAARGGAFPSRQTLPRRRPPGGSRDRRECPPAPRPAAREGVRRGRAPSLRGGPRGQARRGGLGPALPGRRCRFFFLLQSNPCTTSTTAGTAPRSAGTWPWTSSGIMAPGSWSSPPRWARIASGSTGGCTRCWPTTSTRAGSSSSCLDHVHDETWNAEHSASRRPGLAAPPVRPLPGERGPAVHREPQLESRT